MNAVAERPYHLKRFQVRFDDCTVEKFEMFDDLTEARARFDALKTKGRVFSVSLEDTDECTVLASHSR